MIVSELKKIIRNLPPGSDNAKVSIMGSSKPIVAAFISKKDSQYDYLLLDEEPLEHNFESWEIEDGQVKEIKY